MKIDWLNRAARWRSVFSGWQLGTRPIGDPESDAVRDHREATILLRVEVSAIAALLIKKGVFTEQELREQLDIEAECLCAMYERLFPGFRATDIGMHIDTTRAAETMKGWRP